MRTVLSRKMSAPRGQSIFVLTTVWASRRSCQFKKLRNTPLNFEFELGLDKIPKQLLLKRRVDPALDGGPSSAGFGHDAVVVPGRAAMFELVLSDRDTMAEVIKPVL